MNLYQKSIALFGIALPLVIAGLAVFGLMSIKSRISRSFEEKLTHYEGYERNRKEALVIENEIARKRESVQRWEALVAEETPSAVTSHLSEIEDLLPSKEFQKTAQDHPSGKGGFATVSAQPAGQVRLSFRATFRSMQRALAELETRMPQLQLQELRIEPSTNSGNLNVSLSYTAWEQ